MYKYEEQRGQIFTELGSRILLEMRDKIKAALKVSGSFIVEKVMVSGDSWLMLAVVDYLAELDEIREIKQDQCAGQHRVFVRGKYSNE
jgi:hypothetical protein